MVSWRLRGLGRRQKSEDRLTGAATDKATDHTEDGPDQEPVDAPSGPPLEQPLGHSQGGPDRQAESGELAGERVDLAVRPRARNRSTDGLHQPEADEAAHRAA